MPEEIARRACAAAAAIVLLNKKIDHGIRISDRAAARNPAAGRWRLLCLATQLSANCPPGVCSCARSSASQRAASRA